MPISASAPVVSPLWPSVVFRSTDADELDRQYEGEVTGYAYAREGHPNHDILAAKIDWLEGRPADAPPGLITGSGMAAVSAVLLGLLRAGDQVVAGNQLYGRSLRLMTNDLPRLGLTAALFDPTDRASLEAALTPATRLILVETVSNPTLRVADMEAILAVAAEREVLVAVDNTFTTPRMYQPLVAGAHVVLHSVTKLLAGHADVTLGYVAANHPATAEALRQAVVTWGLTPSPFDCWLAERGLHTFDVRYERAEANARLVADGLAGLDGVVAVLYPGRADHPDHQRAGRLFGPRTGNMVSFVLDGDRARREPVPAGRPSHPLRPHPGRRGHHHLPSRLVVAPGPQPRGPGGPRHARGLPPPLHRHRGIPTSCWPNSPPRWPPPGPEPAGAG